ncbi:MAG: methyltransferase [Clostridiales bacterium]|nr:methyltransferase [Clostridiales bacterium]
MDTTEQIGPYTLRQGEGLPRVGRDSLLLGDFATLRRGDRVCDLGCGAGVLALCLARREERLTLDGLDCQEDCVRRTRENLSANRLTGSAFTGRVEDPPPELPAGRYDLVIANPPYFSPGRGDASPGPRGIARTGGAEGLRPWCRAARRLLRNGGRFALCTRPQGMAALFADLTDCGLEPKRLQPVQSAPDRPANLILLESVAQGRPGLELLPTLIVR